MGIGEELRCSPGIASPSGEHSPMGNGEELHSFPGCPLGAQSVRDSHNHAPCVQLLSVVFRGMPNPKYINKNVNCGCPPKAKPPQKNHIKFNHNEYNGDTKPKRKKNNIKFNPCASKGHDSLKKIKNYITQKCKLK